MTPEETQLFQSLLSEVQDLKKHVSQFNKAIAHRAPTLTSKEKQKSIEASVIASIVSKGKINHKHN